MPTPPTEPLSEIYEYRRIDAELGTAGQPTAGQFPMIRAAGFEAVVNLALPTSDNALPNEGGIVTGLGMAYAHIPVNFQAPQRVDFHTFCGVMSALKGRPVFVHCAANMRVSAFVYLYRILRQHVSVEAAERDLRAIWQPDGAWEKFIQDQIAEEKQAVEKAPLPGRKPDKKGRSQPEKKLKNRIILEEIDDCR